MRKYVIAGVSAVVVIGIMLAVFLVLKQRATEPEDSATLIPRDGQQSDTQGIPVSEQGTVAVCGNYACEDSETAQSCPADCILAEPAFLGGHLVIAYGGDAGAEITLETNLPTTMTLRYGLTDKLE